MIVAAGAVALCAGASQASAQSVDALLDKLVDKGVLSVKEANDLKEESDKNFTTSYSLKSGMPSWVSSLKFNGDFRARYEGFFFENDHAVDRQRYRYRARFGVTAAINDNFEVGLRLSSSEPGNGGSFGGDPISGNTTFSGNGSKKFIYIDLAYGRWTALSSPDLTTTFTIGKMENPFTFSDMVFDADYTPEGAAVQLAYNISDKHVLKFNGGAFVMNEIGSSNNDPYFAGAQLRLDSAWNKQIATSFGVAALMIDNQQALNASRSSTLTPTGTNTTTTWTIPNQNGGNLRSGAVGSTYGNLINHYNPLVADAGITYTLEKMPMYKGAFPIKLAGDYMYNPAASHQNVGWSTGVMFGKSGKKGLWDVSYRYKYLEGDAWFEELVDSDFGAYYQSASARTAGSSGYVAGTNVRGHILKLSYSPYDALTLGATAFFTEAIQENPANTKSATTRLQVDASLKF
ncbi:MAG TPA: putative porin [Candidatus Paceibacterota bacterium]|nr:putative porin [Candidatus Paceibacterota bacterium]